MEREEAKNILKYCRDIDGEIKHNAKAIQDYEDRYYAMNGGTPNESHINSRNKIARPTEAVAINIPEYIRGEVSALEEQNKKLDKLKSAIIQEISKLPLTQKTILYDFYVRGLQWVQISAQIHYSPTQCKKLRNRGLDSLAKQFSANPVIANFNYPC